MATSKEDIRGWIARGQEQKATHLIVVCDTFDNEDYPVFVTKQQNISEVYDAYNGKNMQRVMEVYNLSKDTEAQINQPTSFNF